MEHFISGSTARCAAELVRVNKSTAAYYFHRLREIIYRATEDEAPFSGEIEVDESYFGGIRKGKRGHKRQDTYGYHAGQDCSRQHSLHGRLSFI